MKRRLSIWLQMAVFAALLGAAAALWFGQEHVSQVLAAISGRDVAQKQGTPAGGRRVPVVVELVDRAADDVIIEAIGTARAKRFVTIYPEVAGEITYLGVHAGDRVSAEQILLRLDSRDAELAVDLAKVRVQEAERLLARSQHLRRKNVNPEAKVEDARTVLERFRLQLRQAEEALSKRTIRAPFDGIVGIPKVEIGDRVSTTTPIITVDDRSELLVEIEVPEQFISRLQPGQKLAAHTPSFSGRSFEGTVDKIDSRIDPVSRTVIVRAALPNGQDLLRPGMSFAVELTIPGKSHPSVPELALQWSKGQSYVWRINDGAAEKVMVRTVKRLNDTILVEGDIRDGDMVVVEGVQRLRPGRGVVFTTPKVPPGS